MTRRTIAVQYLEGGRDWSGVDPALVRARLRAAFDRLPIEIVAVGWGLPHQLVDACSEECARIGAALYRWHVLLAGDGDFLPRPEWRAIGLGGAPVPPHGASTEFAFVCPNNPDARAAVLAHLDRVAADGPWAGLMLDRMRFPSPAPDPSTHLACFCAGCHAAAAADDLDLAAVQSTLRGQVATVEGRRALVAALVAGAPGPLSRFRARSISNLIADARQQLQRHNLRLGLDCFSPAIAPMVGQELAALATQADWVKLMTYGHALGPAGIPFELGAAAQWLAGNGDDEGAALSTVGAAARLPMPDGLAELRQRGISPTVLAREASRAPLGGRCFAGLELVEMAGLCELHDDQIARDLEALLQPGIQGIVLSWDLWQIPPERLDLVARLWTL